MKIKQKRIILIYVFYHVITTEYVTCQRSFAVIKVTCLVRTFSPQKEFVISFMINKIFVVKYRIYYNKSAN